MSAEMNEMIAGYTIHVKAWPCWVAEPMHDANEEVSDLIATHYQK